MKEGGGKKKINSGCVFDEDSQSCKNFLALHIGNGILFKEKKCLNVTVSCQSHYRLHDKKQLSMIPAVPNFEKQTNPHQHQTSLKRFDCNYLYLKANLVRNCFSAKNVGGKKKWAKPDRQKLLREEICPGMKSFFQELRLPISISGTPAVIVLRPRGLGTRLGFLPSS